VPEHPVIADTGPIVAFLLGEEPRHTWAVQHFNSLPTPFLTCEPVITETFHLVRRIPGGPQRLFELIERGLFAIDFRLSDESTVLERLMRKYQDLPMSLADACLVRLAENFPVAVVFTLDRHFKIYRKHGRQPIKVIMPED
jgi:predicted nucleic acid-binding protein